MSPWVVLGARLISPLLGVTAIFSFDSSATSHPKSCPSTLRVTESLARSCNPLILIPANWVDDQLIARLNAGLHDFCIYHEDECDGHGNHISLTLMSGNIDHNRHWTVYRHQYLVYIYPSVPLMSRGTVGWIHARNFFDYNYYHTYINLVCVGRDTLISVSDKNIERDDGSVFCYIPPQTSHICELWTTEIEYI